LESVPDVDALIKVTNMAQMYGQCVSLATVPDISANVALLNMNDMYRGCTGLTSFPTFTDMSIKVTNMSGVFEDLGDVSGFDIDFSNWKFNVVVNMTTMFTDTTISATSYDSFLVAFEGGTHITGGSAGTLDAPNQTATGAPALAAHAQLLLDGWTINDLTP
jgi:hypothetical protein